MGLFREEIFGQHGSRYILLMLTQRYVQSLYTHMGLRLSFSRQAISGHLNILGFLGNQLHLNDKQLEG